MKALEHEQQSDFGPSLLGIAPRKLMRASSCIPLDQVEFENNDQRARQCDSGQCFL